MNWHKSFVVCVIVNLVWILPYAFGEIKSNLNVEEGAQTQPGVFEERLAPDLEDKSIGAEDNATSSDLGARAVRNLSRAKLEGEAETDDELKSCIETPVIDYDDVDKVTAPSMGIKLHKKPENVRNFFDIYQLMGLSAAVHKEESLEDYPCPCSKLKKQRSPIEQIAESYHQWTQALRNQKISESTPKPAHGSSNSSTVTKSSLQTGKGGGQAKLPPNLSSRAKLIGNSGLSRVASKAVSGTMPPKNGNVGGREKRDTASNSDSVNSSTFEEATWPKLTSNFDTKNDPVPLAQGSPDSINSCKITLDEDLRKIVLNYINQLKHDFNLSDDDCYIETVSKPQAYMVKKNTTQEMEKLLTSSQEMTNITSDSYQLKNNTEGRLRSSDKKGIFSFFGKLWGTDETNKKKNRKSQDEAGKNATSRWVKKDRLSIRSPNVSDFFLSVLPRSKVDPEDKDVYMAFLKNERKLAINGSPLQCKDP